MNSDSRFFVLSSFLIQTLTLQRILEFLAFLPPMWVWNPHNALPPSSGIGLSRRYDLTEGHVSALRPTYMYDKEKFTRDLTHIHLHTHDLYYFCMHQFLSFSQS